MNNETDLQIGNYDPLDPYRKPVASPTKDAEGDLKTAIEVLKEKAGFHYQSHNFIVAMESYADQFRSTPSSQPPAMQGISAEEYWKLRCELAEECLEKSPCDPDITEEQIKAWKEYHLFIKNYGPVPAPISGEGLYRKVDNKLREYIGTVKFDEGGAGIIWGVNKEEMQMIAEIRGWGTIQNMFPNPKDAEEFQDSVGKLIVDAINTYLEPLPPTEIEGKMFSVEDMENCHMAGQSNAGCKEPSYSESKAYISSLNKK